MIAADTMEGVKTAAAECVGKYSMTQETERRHSVRLQKFLNALYNHTVAGSTSEEQS